MLFPPIKGMTSDQYYHLSTAGPLSPLVVKKTCLFICYLPHFATATHMCIEVFVFPEYLEIGIIPTVTQ